MTLIHRGGFAMTARLLTLALAAAVLVLAGPAQPANASCSHGHADRDTGFGHATEDVVRIRVGPHTSCSILTYTPVSELLYYECWTIGDNIFGVSTWTYVHKSQDWNAAGWMSDYYLSNGGALTRC